MAAGNMSGSDSASPRSVRRSRRPHCKPRNFMHENRETSETPAGEPSRRTAGEGSGRTARMDVCEESHCGIVPTTYLGGLNGSGTVYELSPSASGWTQTVIHSFDRDQQV